MSAKQKLDVLLCLPVMLCASACFSRHDEPRAWLAPKSRNCRTVEFPDGWRLPNDPARAPGYFAEDGSAKLVYRFDPASRDLLVGLVLPAAEGKVEEECPRHFAVSLADARIAEIDAGRWNRAAQIGGSSGIWAGDQRLLLTGEINFLLARAGADFNRERATLSPDRRFIVSSDLSGGGNGSILAFNAVPAKIHVETREAATGKVVASLDGESYSQDPTPLLTGGTWVSDR